MYPCLLQVLFFIYHHTVKTKEHTYTQNSKRFLLSHKCPYMIYFYCNYNILYRVLGWPEFPKQLLININKYLSMMQKEISIANDRRKWWVFILSKCFHAFWHKQMVLMSTPSHSPFYNLQVQKSILLASHKRHWDVEGATICLYVPLWQQFHPNLCHHIDNNLHKDGHLYCQLQMFHVQ